MMFAPVLPVGPCRSDGSPARLALAWLLHRDELVVPIVGSRSIEHLEGDPAVAGTVPDGSTLERLDGAVQRGAVKGTRH